MDIQTKSLPDSLQRTSTKERDFIIVDSETMQFEAIPSMAFGAVGGAGIQAAQIIASKCAEVLITGNVGPKAFQALSAAGIKIVIGAYGTVREAVEKYMRGELKGTNTSTVGDHFGTGGGRRRGWRQGRWEP